MDKKEFRLGIAMILSNLWLGISMTIMTQVVFIDPHMPRTVALLFITALGIIAFALSVFFMNKLPKKKRSVVKHG